MELFEDNTHSFVVKISVEEKPQEDGKQQWQGEITHVSSGSHYLFTQWEKMENFLRQHLKEVSLPPQPQLTWRRWLRRTRSHLTDD